MEAYRVRAGRLQFAQAAIDARTTYELAARDLLNLLNASLSDVATSTPSSSTSADADGVQAEGAIVLEVAGQFTDVQVPKSLGDLRTASLESRPDVQLARHNLLAAERAVELAKAQRSRDVTTSFEYQRVGSDHTLGFITQVPIFLYNNQRAGIAQAEAQRQAVEATLRQAERQAMTDVEKAWQSYVAAQRALALYNADAVGQSQRLQDIAEFTFGQGSTSLFELLDVERTNRQTLMAYNQARANYQMSLWQLEQAVGRPVF
jgi:cobalt-zinc-cadmium efflux system outer membrane protein